MASEEEFEAFVKQNRDLIERMIELQKDSAREFVGAERTIAREAAEHVMGYADHGRARAEDAARTLYQTVTDPEVQRHFMNMGMEFFMGMSAIMARAPMPEFMRDGIASTESSFRSAACRSNEDCGARGTAPKKVSIDVSDDPKRDIDDVFKDSGE